MFLRVVPMILILCSLPTVRAVDVQVVGAGILTGKLSGDVPEGNEDLRLQIGNDYDGTRPFVFNYRWRDLTTTWPYEVSLTPYDAVRALLANQSVGVNLLDVRGPTYVFIRANHTVSPFQLEGQTPTEFFEAEKRRVAFAYDPRWPVAVMWCPDHCPNAPGSVMQVLLQLSTRSVAMDYHFNLTSWALSDFKRHVPLSMDPKEANQRLIELEGVRTMAGSIAAADRDLRPFDDSLWRYPASFHAPMEDHLKRDRAFSTSRLGAIETDLAALEGRILRAAEVGAFEHEAGLTRASVEEARSASLMALRLGVFSLAILIGVEVGKWRYPDYSAFAERKRLSRRRK